MPYPRVIEMPQGMLRPILSGWVETPSGSAKNLTGLLSCKFWMIPVDESGVPGTAKINGVAGAIADAANGKLTYTWTGTDTDTAGRYRSYFIGYWGASSTIPQYFKGPEIVIYTPGSRLTF